MLPSQDPAEVLISPEEYYRRYKAGQLADLRINQDLINQYEQMKQKKEQEEREIALKAEENAKKKSMHILIMAANELIIHIKKMVKIVRIRMN